MNAAEVAIPPAFVIAVLTPPAKVPLAPLFGAVNVTFALGTGFPKASWTNVTNGFANAVPTVVLCADPEKTEIASGALAMTVRVNNCVALGVTSF